MAHWTNWNGIMAVITNHGYLGNPTFRRMRKNLIENFNEIYILDLHGNVKKRERSTMKTSLIFNRELQLGFL
jgi:predicted helicase